MNSRTYHGRKIEYITNLVSEDRSKSEKQMNDEADTFSDKNIALAIVPHAFSSSKP